MKIKKGDTVQIITGKDRGQKGLVTLAIPKENRVVVEGMNLKTFWKKDGSGVSHKKQEATAVDVSNVALLDPKTGKPTRVGIKKENGKIVRIAKKSGSVIK
jgi:large subunit ribosomal protein L24